jgi:hypothetical protein
MKRLMMICAVVVTAFVSGWIGACVILQGQFTERQLHLQERMRGEIKQWQAHVKTLRQTLYRPDLHRTEDAPDKEALYAEFVPSKTTENITLSYVANMGGRDFHIILYGNGDLYSEDGGKRHRISSIPNERCIAFFRSVLTSGILNHSDEVLTLKMGLLDSEKSGQVTDRGLTKIHISVPDLNIKKAISISAPDIELENFPDIIELQLFTQLEKSLLDLVPEGFPLWK